MKDKSSKSKNIKRINFLANTRNQTLMWLLLIPTVLSLIVNKWNPIVKGIYMSFFHTKGYKTTGFAGLENYINALTDTEFLATLGNTAEYVGWSLIIGALPPIILAIMLNEVVHGKQIFKVLTYLPAVAPALAISMIWMNIYSPAPGGLINSFLSNFGVANGDWLLNEKLVIPLIILTSTWSGYAPTALLYLSSLQSLNQDLYEAAVIDGAGIWRRIFTITIPHIAPMMLLCLVKQIIGVFQVMELPLVMTGGGPNNASLSLNLTSYKFAFQYMQVDRSLALGTITFIILVFATIGYFWLDKKLSE